jgi:hypothetical protein
MIPYLTIGKWIGGTVAGLLIAWGLYAGLIRPTTKPNPTTTQSGETINNFYNQPRISFGCARWSVNEKSKAEVPSSDNSKPN